MPATARTGLLLPALGLLVIAGSLYFLVSQLIPIYQKPFSFDMRLFASAGADFWKTGQLYERSANLAETYRPGAPVFKFPPPYQIFLAPWLHGGIPASFYTVARTLAILAYLAAAGLCLHLAKPATAPGQSRLPFFILAIPLVCLLSSFYDALRGLSTEIPLLFLLVLAFAWRERKPFQAGLLLAIAVTTKLYPAFMLAWFFLRAPWRSVAAGFVAGCAAILLASIALFGVGEHAFFAQQVLPVLLQEKPVVHSLNLTILQFLHTHGLLADMSLPFFNASRILLGGTLLAALLRGRQGDPRQEALLYALTLVTMLLCLPNYWLQYHVLLLFPLLVLFGHWMQQRQWGQLALFLPVLVCLAAEPEWAHDLLQQAFGSEAGMARVIAQESAQHGALVTLLRHSPLGVLVSACVELRPLAPLAIWLALLLALCARRENPGTPA